MVTQPANPIQDTNSKLKKDKCTKKQDSDETTDSPVDDMFSKTIEHQENFPICLEPMVSNNEL